MILIERDDAYRYVLARALRGVRFEVSTFRRTTLALEHLEQSPDDGLGFARMMRHRNSDARIALISADPHDTVETDAFGGVLKKTADCVEMALMIRKRLCAAGSG